MIRQFALCFVVMSACGQTDSNNGSGPIDGEIETAEGVNAALGAIALDKDCLYVASTASVDCYSLSDGSVTAIAEMDSWATVRLRVANGHLYGTGLPLAFGPEERDMRVWTVPTTGGDRQDMAVLFAGFGAGEGFVVDPGQVGVVYATTGGSADLYRIDGESAERLASESGSMGDLAFVGDQLAFVNGFSIQSIPAASREEVDAQQVITLSAFDELVLASQGSRLFAAGSTRDNSTELIEIIDGEKVVLAEVPGTVQRLALTSETAFLSLGAAGVVAISLADGTVDEILDAGPAFELAASDAVVAWVDEVGAIHLLR